jgi:hypothetical protein
MTSLRNYQSKERKLITLHNKKKSPFENLGEGRRVIPSEASNLVKKSQLWVC